MKLFGLPGGTIFRIVVLAMLAINSSHANPVEFEYLYGKLLVKYWRPAVRIHGIKTTVFDYAQMKQDAQKPDSLFNRTLQAINQVDPAELQGENAAKAFWINAYNFASMRLVIDHYPVDSIRSMRISLFRYPWSKQAIGVGNQRYSLKQIEKEILLEQFGDPRIIFAISCAAVSCPDAAAAPFTAKQLDSQLDGVIRRFFRNPGKGLRLERNKRAMTLSWLLKKDGYLFQDYEGGVLGFVQTYLEADRRDWIKLNSPEIDYFEHDWTLNDPVQVD